MSSNKPIILVDTSYTSFYRFFATIRWFSFAYPEEFKDLKSDNKYDWSKNEIFIKKYEKMYLESIIKLVKKKIFTNSNIIFCMDTPKEKLWRMEIQENYKSGRCDLSLKHNFKTTFDYTYDFMIPKIIEQNKNIHKLRMDEVEADDIIACISMYLNETNPIQQVYLVSGDEDFLQLGRDNVTFINYKKKKPFVLSKDDADKALLNKIINGDPSDCIPSIFPKGKRINKKEILESNIKLKEYLELNIEPRKQYEINKIMIDFNNIPKKYYNKIINLYNKLSI
jgi:5'-3' exonuclease